MHNSPLDAFKKLSKEYLIKAVFTNHDYEPYAMQRDKEMGDYFSSINVSFQSFKDQVIFEKNEILKSDGKPYTIFTPYSRKWRISADEFYFKSYPCEKYFDNFWSLPALF